MPRVRVCVLLAGLIALSGSLAGQEPKKDDPKAKQGNPPAKAKGILPTKWGQLGLSDEQKQNIYKAQGKYNEEIDKLEEKIKELKATRDKEMRAVLTADQRKKLEELLLGKDK